MIVLVATIIITTTTSSASVATTSGQGRDVMPGGFYCRQQLDAMGFQPPQSSYLGDLFRINSETGNAYLHDPSGYCRNCVANGSLSYCSNVPSGKVCGYILKMLRHRVENIDVKAVYRCTESNCEVAERCSIGCSYGLCVSNIALTHCDGSNIWCGLRWMNDGYQLPGWNPMARYNCVQEGGNFKFSNWGQCDGYCDVDKCTSNYTMIKPAS